MDAFSLERHGLRVPTVLRNPAPAVVGAESVRIHGKSFTSNGVTVKQVGPV